MRATIWAAGLALGMLGQAQAASLPLDTLFSDLGISGTLTITSITPEGTRCRIAATAETPDMLAELDRKGQAEGNMGSDWNRLFWVGPTALQSVEGPGTLRLASRVRYENWIEIDFGFDTLKTKTIQETLDVDLQMRVQWDGDLDTLSLAYQLVGIRGVPDEILSALGQLGLQMGGASEMSLPATETTQTLSPQIEDGPRFRATPDGKGLYTDLTVSAELPRTALVNSCIALQSALQNTPERLADFLASVIRGM